MSVADELRMLQEADPDKILRPRVVVDWARVNPNSYLHRDLEWNNEVAGDAYRLAQARQLIAIHVVNVEGKRELISLSIDRIVPDGGYRSVETVMRQPTLRKIALADALAELERVRLKYQWLEELARVWAALDAAKTGPTASAPKGRRRRGRTPPSIQPLV